MFLWESVFLYKFDISYNLLSIFMLLALTHAVLEIVACFQRVASKVVSTNRRDLCAAKKFQYKNERVTRKMNLEIYFQLREKLKETLETMEIGLSVERFRGCYSKCIVIFRVM